MSLFRTIASAPLIAMTALILTLPYALAALFCWIVLVPADLPEGFVTAAEKFAEWLPRRRASGFHGDDSNFAQGLVYLAGIWLTVLVLFRVHRSVLRVMGHGDTGRFWMLISPSRAWFLTVLLPVVLIFVGTVALSRTPGWAENLYAPVVQTWPQDFIKAHLSDLGFLLAALMLVFMPFGVMLTQYAASAPLPFSTFCTGAISVLIYGVVFCALAVALSIILLKGVSVVLTKPDETAEPFNLLTYLILQALLAWTMLITATVRLLERRIDKAIDAEAR